MISKSLFTCCIILIFSLNGSAQNGPVIPEQPKITVKEAVEILSACECFVKSIHAPLSVEEHKLVVSFSVLKKLGFNTLDSLYIHGNDIIKLYSFGLITSNFPDSLSEHHLLILKNKHKVGVYQKGPEDFPKERISDIATEMYADMEKRRAEQIQKDRVETIIRTFISTYAMYPESYIPVSFTNYTQFMFRNYDDPENVVDSEVHILVHSYRLKTIKGDLVSVSHYFTLNSAFAMIFIEAEERVITSCLPPELDFWLNEFGRELTESDREVLQLR